MRYPATPRWLLPTLLVAVACLFCATAALAFAGAPVLPVPLTSIVFLILVGAIVILVVCGLTNRVLERLDEVAGASVERDRRILRVVDQSDADAIFTGEIPRIGQACPMLPADNVKAFELGRRAERGVRPAR